MTESIEPVRGGQPRLWPVTSPFPPMVPLDACGDADALLRGCFAFYGEAIELGERWDWDHNPGTAHWIHDLNRFCFLQVLNEAWERTGNMAYPRRSVALVLDWIERCPLEKALQRDGSVWTAGAWANVLTIAIRIENWALTLPHIAERAPEILGEDDVRLIRRSMREQIEICTRLLPASKGNWAAIVARALLTAVSALRDDDGACSLAASALDRFLATLSEQILPDGAQFELSTHYHWVTTESLCSCLVLAQSLGLPVGSNHVEKARAMVHYLRQLISPDGLCVAFNDSDPGYGWRILEFLNAPALAALLGETASPALESEVFPFAGIAILREGSHRGRTLPRFRCRAARCRPSARGQALILALCVRAQLHRGPGPASLRYQRTIIL